jgi:hypothetical protein
MAVSVFISKVFYQIIRSTSRKNTKYIPSFSIKGGTMALDRLAIVLKVGDQETAPGKEHLGIKEGMIVTCIDEQEYADTLEKIISEHMKKVYAIVEIDRTLKDKILEWMRPVGVTVDEDTGKEIITDVENYRPRGRALPLEDLD